MDYAIVEKYNVAVPRYTSYPPVPNWQTINKKREWLDHIGLCLQQNEEGISLYIHLPFCEQLCTYCGCNKRITLNHGVEAPYIDVLLKEWAHYVALAGDIPIIINELHLGGGTPTFFKPSELKRLIQGILDTASVSVEAAFSFEAHPNSTSYEHLITLYELGFKRISIGVQDLSPTIMKAINRNQTAEEIEHVTLCARSIGFTSVNYDLIYGLPFQSIQDIEITMNFVNKMRPDRIAFYGYAHVPWKSAGQRAFSDDDVPNGYEKFLLKEAGYQKLGQQGYELIGMDHFALKSDSLFISFSEGKMHRNFMGYTDQKTNILIGLGASSISETNEMYVQNEKTIETYSALIENESSAVIKEHHMTTMQKITKKHILDLMCTYETSFTEMDEDQVTLSLHMDKIKSLVSDDIINFEEGGNLKINNCGKDFIRNVCAAIDPEFETVTDSKMYSLAT